ncbi:hypothetical protein [Kribbella sp. NPDC048915]
MAYVTLRTSAHAGTPPYDKPAYYTKIDDRSSRARHREVVA